MEDCAELIFASCVMLIWYWYSAHQVYNMNT